MNETIVFHFKQDDLFDVFFNDISSSEFIKEIKKTPKTCKQVFLGCRVDKKNIRLPNVQSKIKYFCERNQTLRDILCKSWLAAKKETITKTLELIPYNIRYDSDGRWFKEFDRIEKKYGFITFIQKLILAMIYLKVDSKDIKIFISIFSINFQDQDNIERLIDDIIANKTNYGGDFIDDLHNNINAEEENLKKIEKDQTDNLIEIKSYKIELKNLKEKWEKYHNSININKKDILDNEDKIAQEIAKNEEFINQLRKEKGVLKEKIRSIEFAEKKERENFEYESSKLDEALKNIIEGSKILEEKKAQLSKNMLNKKNLCEILKKQIEEEMDQVRKERLEQKGVTNIDDVHTKIKTLKTNEILINYSNVLGILEPLKINNKGFFATPSSLDLLGILSNENFEYPSIVPKIPEDNKDIKGLVDYWKFKSFWENDNWDQESTIYYSYFRSIQLQDQNQKLAAEIALSGLYHAEKIQNEDLEILMLYRFVMAINYSDINFDYSQIDEDDLVNEIEISLDGWERKPLTVNFFGLLSIICPSKLNYLFEISKRRTRIFLKRCLSNGFKDTLKFDEHDPSHEIIHLVNSTMEQHDSRIRSSCARWLIQDSVDGIAQNSRNEIMKNIAKYPDLGRRSNKIILNDFESQISTPLTNAIRNTDPKNFEELLKQTINYTKKLVKDREWFSSAYLFPCTIHLAKLASEKDVQIKRMFRAAIALETDKEHYPLNEKDRPCNIDIIIKNIGNSPAKGLKLLFMPTTEIEDVEIKGAESSYSLLEANHEIRHKIEILLKNRSQALEIEYIVNWMDSSSMDERSHTGTLKLLSQRTIDWENAQNLYSLKSIKDPDRLKGRSNVLNILRRSKKTMDSYYITGQRRTGKSSVAQVYHLELNAYKDCLSIYMYWGELGVSELAPLCHVICYEIYLKLLDLNPEVKVTCPTIDDFRGNENYTFRRYIKDLNTKFPDLKFYLIIDDFDELPSSLHQTEEGDRFFTLLRALLDQEYIALFLVGSEKLPEILKRQGERLNLNQRCEIDYLDDINEIKKIITEPALGTLEFNDDAISEIVFLSCGNPYYATLICSRLFNFMAQKKDYYVSKRDVQICVENMVEEDTLSTYQHFWKDGVFLPGRLGERQQYHNAKVLISISRAQIAENDLPEKGDILKREDLMPLSIEDANYAIKGLIERKVLVENKEGICIRVPIVGKWIERNGPAIERSFAEAGLDEVPINISRGLTSRDIIEISQDLVYQDKEINEIQISDWLSQFGSSTQQKYAYKLLKRLREEGYFNQSTMYTGFKELHKDFVTIEASKTDYAPRTERKNVINIILSYLDPDGKSGISCQYLYRKVNRIHSKCGVPPHNLAVYLKELKTKLPIVFADDIIGTGGTVSKGYYRLKNDFKNQGLNIKDYNLYLAVISATKYGIEKVEDETEGQMQLLIWKEIDERLTAFSEKSEIFKSDEERISAKELIEEIGKDLEPKNPLGWNKSQLLVAFQHGCPNNTLPIFYKTGRTYRGKEWRPVFPR